MVFFSSSSPFILFFFPPHRLKVLKGRCELVVIEAGLADVVQVLNVVAIIAVARPAVLRIIVVRISLKKKEERRKKKKKMM